MNSTFLLQILFAAFAHYRISETLEPMFQNDPEIISEYLDYSENLISAMIHRVNPPTLCQISIELRRYVCYTIAKAMIEGGTNVIINHDPLQQENNLTCVRQHIRPMKNKRMIFCDAVLVQRENDGELIEISGFFASRGAFENAAFVYSVYPLSYVPNIAQYVLPENRGYGTVPYLTVIGHVRNLEYKKERLTEPDELPLYNPPFGTLPITVYVPRSLAANLIPEFDNGQFYSEEIEEH